MLKKWNRRWRATSDKQSLGSASGIVWNMSPNGRSPRSLGMSGASRRVLPSWGWLHRLDRRRLGVARRELQLPADHVTQDRENVVALRPEPHHTVGE